MWNSRKDY
jgi:hypothetical protein